MNFKSILKVVSVLVAIAGAAAAIYFAIQKLTGTKEAEYFDDNEFFECDNDLEIVEAAPEETVVEEAEAPKEEKAAKKSAPKKKAAKKTSK